MTIQALRHILIFQILVGFPVLLGIHLMTTHGIAIPDLLWSYDAEGLHKLFHEWGPEKRERYRFITFLDLFLYIPGYTIFFITVIAYGQKLAGFQIKLIFVLPLITATWDSLETIYFNIIVSSFPERSLTWYSFLANTATRAKFIGIGLSVLFGFVLSAYGLIKGPRRN